MRIAFLFIITLFVTASCQEGKEDIGDGYILKGQIQNLTKDYIYVDYLQGQEWKTIDSVKAEEDGSFKFKGKVTDPDFYMLKFDGGKALMLIMENKEIIVQADANNLIKSVQVSGSKPSAEYLEFNRRLTALEAKENQYKSTYMRLQDGGEMNKDSLALITTKLNSIPVEGVNMVKNYIDSIMPSMAVFGIVQYLDPNSEMEYLIDISEKLLKEFPKSKYSKTFSEEISRLAKSKAQQEQAQKNALTEGMLAPDFSMTDVDGKTFNLSSLKGKYVLLDFWASWCGPCRMENPNVVRIYERFKNKNFEILGVSLDNSKEAWLKAIEKDGLKWKHVSDLSAWQSKVVPLYGIQGIPATFLLDKEGKIIAQNLRGRQLEEKLEQVLLK